MKLDHGSMISQFQHLSHELSFCFSDFSNQKHKKYTLSIWTNNLHANTFCSEHDFKSTLVLSKCNISIMELMSKLRIVHNSDCQVRKQHSSAALIQFDMTGCNT